MLRDEFHARRFYEKNGFKPIREAKIEAPRDGKLDLPIYQLRLNHS